MKVNFPNSFKLSLATEAISTAYDIIRSLENNFLFERNIVELIKLLYKEKPIYVDILRVQAEICYNYNAVCVFSERSAHFDVIIDSILFINDEEFYNVAIYFSDMVKILDGTNVDLENSIAIRKFREYFNSENKSEDQKWTLINL